MSGKKWSATEEELLRRAYGSAPVGRIARVLGRTSFSVYKRASELGLRRRSNAWTEREDSLLMERYGYMSARELGELIGRTAEAVRTRMTYLRRRGEVDAA